MMYRMKIDWKTFTIIENETIVENGEIPLHIQADSYETALAEATMTAQKVARGFNGTKTEFYYRIIH